MAHPEIEPWAAKTILLLRSSADNALEDLRTTLVDAIYTKYHDKKEYKPIPPLFGPLSSISEKIKSKDSKSSLDKAKGSGYSSSINLASPESISDSDNSSSNEDEMVILEDNSSCVVCKDAITAPWNQLAECAECHNLYHQQCHIPAIPDSEVNDPRTVWYCRNCTKTVSKPKTSSGTSSTTSSSSKSSSSKPGSGRTSSPSFNSKTFGGSSGKSGSSSKSGNNKISSNSSSTKSAPNINMVSADKRLQIMKKKAAKKQEKRPK